MLELKDREYRKIYDAIYDFDLLELEHIQAPTLVLNGKNESAGVMRHTRESLKRVRNARALRVPLAGHTSSMENPSFFNQEVLEFLAEVRVLA
jgi:pimeloyl-ACP methyl ester carboxylesterase